MFRPAMLAIATVALLGTGSLVAHGRGAEVAMVAKPDAPAVARAEAPAVIDDAVAAALIGSITREFDTANVTVQLADVQVQPLSVRDREVTGTGRVRIGGDPEWIDVRFTALFDTELAEVSQPRLQLGALDASRTTAPAAVSDRLEARMEAALDAEFAGQPVAWQPGRTEVSRAGGRLLRVSGNGVADFGVEGRVDAQVEGLYDTASRRFVNVRYELGPAVDTHGAIAAL